MQERPTARVRCYVMAKRKSSPGLKISEFINYSCVLNTFQDSQVNWYYCSSDLKLCALQSFVIEPLVKYQYGIAQSHENLKSDFLEIRQTLSKFINETNKEILQIPASLAESYLIH